MKYFNYKNSINFLYCFFCLNILTNNNFNNSFIISENSNPICLNCVFFINKIYFVYNYYLYFYYYINFDNYINYLYCYVFCKNCIFYFKNNYRLKIIFNNIFCEFKNKYYDFVNDYYDFYFYCFNLNCLYCSKYFFYNIYIFKFKIFIKRQYFNINILKYKSYNEIYDFIHFIFPEEIYEFLSKFIIGQEYAKKTISVAIYNHYKKIKLNLFFDKELTKNNILIIGPSGSGKTFLLKTLSKILNIPIIVFDATTLTEVGYVGEDAENMIQLLFEESLSNKDLTEIGIIFIDEIDKIASKNLSNSNNRDISGEGVQQSLLKIIESKFCFVSKFNEDTNDFFFIEINTENILFICAGAFSSIENYYNNKNTFYKKYNIFEVNSLIKFGIIPELLGRFSFIIKFDCLNTFFLKKIILDSENSIISYYKNLFIFENVNLFICDKALNIISDLSFKLELGSRALKIVIDKILINIMYKLPNLYNLKKIIINSNIFEDNVDGPLLIYDI